MQEAFTVYDRDSADLVRARTRADTAAAWHRLWDVPSYQYECTYEYATRGDSTNGIGWWVAACLFVADDSLLAYGFVADTNQDARTFADMFVVPHTGYYRFDAPTRTFTRTALLAPAFADACKREVHKEHRDPGP